MTMSDPISDMLTRIRNAQSSNKSSVSIPSSSLKISIAEVLKKEGYIVDFEVSDDQVKKYIVIGLKYHEGVPVIESIERGKKTPPGGRKANSPAGIREKPRQKASAKVVY